MFCLCIIRVVATVHNLFIFVLGNEKTDKMKELHPSIGDKTTVSPIKGLSACSSADLNVSILGHLAGSVF